MKIKFNFFILLFCVIALSIGCKPKPKATENLAPNVHKVVAKEVIQASGYTYVRVLEDSKENWIATTKQVVEIDKFYYYMPNIEMSNFESKELKRTFPTIIFVDKFTDQPITPDKPDMSSMMAGKKAAVAKEGIKVEPVKGSITIAELYANKDSYAGKAIKIRGEVVKYNGEIMGKNWVHLQDGTNSNGSFDITITTNDVTKVGDVVTFEGTVALKKDFGAGYLYEVIVENSKLIP